MDFSEGIPPERARWWWCRRCSTSARTSTTCVEALEVRFLANRDAHLHFCLLTDFPDARAETHAGRCDRCCEQARDRHRRAERKIPRADDADTFFLFHRPRRWNPRERVWMGYERKRGKLADLNALLRGGATRSLLAGRRRDGDACPTCSTSSRSTPTRSCRATPRGNSSAAMAHPLNRARYDERRAARRAKATASCSRAWRSACQAPSRSRFARLFGGEPGIDPYTRAVSDVYQDLFGEGSFIGKGIYDVDAFEQCARRTASRKPHPQPRSAGRLLRARRAAERRAAVRGLSAQLSAPTCSAAPSLDPRRLADRRAGCCRACPAPGGAASAAIRCRRCRAGRSSTTCGAAWCRRR